MQADIRYLFEPRSVAVIGASSNPEKIGNVFIDNILSSGFKGAVYPVNPSGGRILGLPVYKSLGDIPGEVDLACIAIGADMVFDAVKDCAAKGVKFAVVIAAGFSESGNVEEEREIVSYASAHNLRILGPNIFGVYSSMAPVNATFGPKHITAGDVGIITQSGAIAVSMIGLTREENIGLSAIIPVGNKADIDEVDLLDYLLAHDGTRVILMYIEGVRQGARFVEALKRATRIKPVVVIKAGKSPMGALAAASHTGSLAGEDKMFDDIARQCGAVRAETIHQALNWCKLQSAAPRPAGENTVVITNGGGMGVMCADACEKYGVRLFDDRQALEGIFAPVVPSFGSYRNPVDLTGDTTADSYFDVVNRALADDTTDSLICIGIFGGPFKGERYAHLARELFSGAGPAKPVIFSLTGDEGSCDPVAMLKERGIPVYPDVYEAVAALGALNRTTRAANRQPESKEADPDIDISAVETVINRACAEKRSLLMAHEAEAFMKAAGIKTPASRLCSSLEETVKAAGSIGYPVVLKIASPDIVHKSDAGGIALDLKNDEELADAYQAILVRCRQHCSGARITGVEVAEMVRPGIETVVGARRDASFGPVIMFGLGGIYVEVLKDIVFRALPVQYAEIRTMISELKSYALLLGIRGEAKKDIEAIADTITRVGYVLQRCGKITDIEINPLTVYEAREGVAAVDARIILGSSND